MGEKFYQQMLLIWQRLRGARCYDGKGLWFLGSRYADSYALCVYANGSQSWRNVYDRYLAPLFRYYSDQSDSSARVERGQRHGIKLISFGEEHPQTKVVCKEKVAEIKTEGRKTGKRYFLANANDSEFYLKERGAEIMIATGEKFVKFGKDYYKVEPICYYELELDGKPVYLQEKILCAGVLYNMDGRWVPFEESTMGFWAIDLHAINVVASNVKYEDLKSRIRKNSQT